MTHRVVREAARREAPSRRAAGVGSPVWLRDSAPVTRIVGQVLSHHEVLAPLGAGHGPGPAIPSCASPRPATAACDACWSRVRSTPWDPSARSPTCGAGAWPWRTAAARPPGSARSSPWPASWPCCCIACGCPARSTSRCARPPGPRAAERFPHSRHAPQLWRIPPAHRERAPPGTADRTAFSCPVRVTALHVLAQRALRCPGRPAHRWQHPNWTDPSQHRAATQTGLTQSAHGRTAENVLRSNRRP